MSTSSVAAEPLVRIEADDATTTLGGVPSDAVVGGLRERGAVLLSGFGADLDEFVALTDRLGTDWNDYRGGGFRFGALDRRSVDPSATVMTATGRTQEFPVPLHGELYYFEVRPRLLWFFCQTPPPEGGGETTVCDGATLLEAVSESTRAYLTEHRIVFRRRLAGDEWRQSFMTEDIDVVRRICAENRTDVAYDPELDELHTSYACDPVIPNPLGRPAFMTSLLPIWFAEWVQRSGRATEVLKGSSDRTPPIVVRTEAGDEVPSEVVMELVAVGDRIQTAVTWSAGDIVVVDNARVLHGRAPSTSAERMVYVRMGEPAFAL